MEIKVSTNDFCDLFKQCKVQTEATKSNWPYAIFVFSCNRDDQIWPSVSTARSSKSDREYLDLEENESLARIYRHVISHAPEGGRFCITRNLEIKLLRNMKKIGDIVFEN